MDDLGVDVQITCIEFPLPMSSIRPLSVLYFNKRENEIRIFLAELRLCNLFILYCAVSVKSIHVCGPYSCCCKSACLSSILSLITST